MIDKKILSITEYSYKTNNVNGSKQEVVSQHAKTTTTISCPTIDRAASDPHRVKNHEGRVWYGDSHDNATPKTNTPSNQLGNKAERMTTPIISYPCYYTRYSINQRVLPTV